MREKYAWLLLLLSSALFVPTSVFFILSFFGTPYASTPGDLDRVLAGSPSVALWIRGIFRDCALAQLGMGIFGMTIAAVSYRKRERWAWFTLWYLPVAFLAYVSSQALLGNSILFPSALLVISLLGLLLPFRRFWRRQA